MSHVHRAPLGSHGILWAPWVPDGGPWDPPTKEREGTVAPERKFTSNWCTDAWPMVRATGSGAAVAAPGAVVAPRRQRSATHRWAHSSISMGQQQHIDGPTAADDWTDNNI